MTDDSVERTDASEEVAVSDTPGATAGEVRSDSPGEGSGAREVEVPMELFKTVTVFATLIAMVLVLFGFMFLDAATVQTGPLLWLLDAVTGWIGVSYDADALRVPFGLVGLASICVGAFVYAFSTRFRARGMGKSKDGSDEDSGNG